MNIRKSELNVECPENKWRNQVTRMRAHIGSVAKKEKERLIDFENGLNNAISSSSSSALNTHTQGSLGL